MEFKTNDFTTASPDTNFMSRGNEMEIKNVENEVFKCDPCTKSKTRKEFSSLGGSDKVLFYINGKMGHFRDGDKNFKNVEHFSPSLSEVRETAYV